MEQAIKSKPDLFILDHLHYFSSEEDKTEIESLSAVMRQVRVMTRRYRIPIVIVSQMRKPAIMGSGARGQVPTLYDLHGTGNIGKEAITVILLHRTKEGQTEIIIDKSRHFGRMDFRLLFSYDQDTRQYKPAVRVTAPLPKRKNPHLPYD
jgi:replicative DNA helicase